MYFLFHTISIHNYNTHIFLIMVKINMKAGKMAQMLKHLPGKHEEWSSDPHNSHKQYMCLATHV